MCDIILCKLIKNLDLEKFIKMMKYIIVDECCSFGYLLCFVVYVMESLNDGKLKCIIIINYQYFMIFRLF